MHREDRLDLAEDPVAPPDAQPPERRELLQAPEGGLYPAARTVLLAELVRPLVVAPPLRHGLAVQVVEDRLPALPSRRAPVLERAAVAILRAEDSPPLGGQPPPRLVAPARQRRHAVRAGRHPVSPVERAQVDVRFAVRGEARAARAWRHEPDAALRRHPDVRVAPVARVAEQPFRLHAVLLRRVKHGAERGAVNLRAALRHDRRDDRRLVAVAVCLRDLHLVAGALVAGLRVGVGRVDQDLPPGVPLQYGRSILLLLLLLLRLFPRLCLPLLLHLLGQDTEKVLEARHVRDPRLPAEALSQEHQVGHQHGGLQAFRHALPAHPLRLREYPAVVAAVAVEEILRQAPVFGRETPLQLHEEVLDHVVEKPLPRQDRHVPVHVRRVQPLPRRVDAHRLDERQRHPRENLRGRLVLREQPRIAVQRGLRQLRAALLDVERVADAHVEDVALDRLPEGPAEVVLDEQQRAHRVELLAGAARLLGELRADPLDRHEPQDGRAHQLPPRALQQVPRHRGQADGGVVEKKRFVRVAGVFHGNAGENLMLCYSSHPTSYNIACILFITNMLHIYFCLKISFF